MAAASSAAFVTNENRALDPFSMAPSVDNCILALLRRPKPGDYRHFPRSWSLLRSGSSTAALPATRPLADRVYAFPAFSPNSSALVGHPPFSRVANSRRALPGLHGDHPRMWNGSCDIGRLFATRGPATAGLLMTARRALESSVRTGNSLLEFSLRILDDGLELRFRTTERDNVVLADVSAPLSSRITSTFLARTPTVWIEDERSTLSIAPQITPLPCSGSKRAARAASDSRNDALSRDLILHSNHLRLRHTTARGSESRRRRSGAPRD